jgi:glycosyltransferase involved in cell wall biosynthesis
MRVVYVSTIERGGPLTHLRELVPRVAAEGVEVHVLCGSEELAESFRGLGVSAQAAPIAHKLDLPGAAALLPHLRDADVVHTHDRRAGLFGRLAGRMRRARVVHTLHGMPEEIAARIGREQAPDPPGVSAGRIAWLLHGYLRIEALLTGLGHVVAPSQAMADFMLAHGFPARLVHVIPYGVETAQANGPRAASETLVAGVASNLEYWKGIDVLLEAARLTRAPVRLEL